MAEFELNPRAGGFVLLIIGAVFLILVLSSSTYIVEPGSRAVSVTLGKVNEQFLPEGFGLKLPFFTNITQVSVRQQTKATKAECFSSDLQQVDIDLRILYRVPEASVVKIFQQFAGDPFDSLISPRVNEAIKEVTANHSAEQIVKQREQIKQKAIALAREKVGTILIIEDLVIHNVALSKELEHAIEAKMVQEQETAKSKFVQQKAQIEAGTAVIKAKGEAEAIAVRGRAIRENPGLVQLQIVEKWDGKTPMVVGGGTGGGANILLPLGKSAARD